MKRICEIPVKVLLFAIKNDLYGIVFGYGAVIGGVIAAIIAKSIWKGMLALLIVAGAYAALRIGKKLYRSLTGTTKYNTYDAIRRKEQREKLKVYLGLE